MKGHPSAREGQGMLSLVGICCYPQEEVQTRILLFTGVSASAELPFMFAIAKALR